VTRICEPAASSDRGSREKCKNRSKFRDAVLKRHVKFYSNKQARASQRKDKVMFISATTDELKRRTRFVLVNDCTPSGDGCCAVCGRTVEKGYVRDPQTRLIFCDTQCFAGHAFSIKSHARIVS
jgi:hypothetical protein